ncbi:MAG: DNA gyrase subunit A [Bacillota bacterium]|nr:DNA gyrase subunit A [Bacillota bacterium]HPZ92824.1 DNA gyrase subunit A [Bacillota bacterium]
MLEFTDGKIIPIDLKDEMKRSYMLYSMSVIVGRALPDVRDGLKPIHRRILYAMNEIGLTSDKPHRKSATIVGEVMGKYHPHGDAAIYDALVRMAQDFSQRYPLIDGHGNFGSVDGDPPAAMRYTEARMARISQKLLADIDKDTVDFQPNFDESLKEPVVLPCRFPNLLVNGSSGIAVGMATNIPPHNLREVIDGVIMLIDNPDAKVEDLMTVIKGPDFPTAGIIVGKEGIRSAYTTGRGSIRIRAAAQIESLSGGRNRIIVSEIPYQVNKSRLIEHIAELVRDKKIDGITDLRDESDREGIRIVIDVRRDANPNVILNQLYRHTQMQTTFGVIMLVIVNGEPKLLDLKSVISHYIEYQKEIVVRRTRFDLNKAEERAHILEGLKIALDNLDAVINLIRSSRTPDIAREGLMKSFNLTEKQAQAILDMRLQRLTGLERRKIEDELKDIMNLIKELKGILADEQKVLQIIKEELLEIKETFGDDRRTRITAGSSDFDVEDLIAEEDIAVTLTHQGYIKRMPLNTYKSQRRGGRGITATNPKEEDFVEHLFIATTLNYILFFTDKGRVYSLKAYEIPEASRQARGTAIVNLIPLMPDETIRAVIPIRTFAPDKYLLMATRRGIVKKTALEEFDTKRKTGLLAIRLDPDDDLVSVKRTTGNQEIIIVTAQGLALRFSEEDVRPMGRSARGVIGIRLGDGDTVIGMDVVREDRDLLVVTENGYGKRTPLNQYRTYASRGGRGVKAITLTDKTGLAVAIKVLEGDDELMCISAEGVVIRMDAADISQQGRGAQGVRVMRLDPEDKVVSIAQIVTKNGG